MKHTMVSAGAALLIFGCAVSHASASATLTLKSDAFKDGATIPQVYSCDGKDISPQLSWSGVPANTKSFALTVFDPDARGGAGFWHWVLYDVAADVTSLAVGIRHGGTEGANGRGENKFAGPCPPPGDTPHHYIFTLYALDFVPKGDFDGPQLDDAMKGHVLAKAVLVGRFGR